MGWRLGLEACGAIAAPVRGLEISDPSAAVFNNKGIVQGRGGALELHL